VSADRPRFLAITGATASGKTELSLALAERIPVEIISMDSRQVYTGMDIGTAKVDAGERAAVPHHGLDLVAPDERYSAGRYARDVRGWIEEIESRGALPLLVGGTGFFLRSVMEPIFQEPPLEPERLDRLRAWLADVEPERLAEFVTALDPARAEVAIEGGPQRMSRTIEVALLSGIPLSRWHREAPQDGPGVPGVVVALDLPRDEMYRRIDDRVSRMIERGLVEEVRSLLDAGYRDGDPGMSGTGYREVTAYLRGESTLEEAMELIRRNTRRYARRQMTWFRHQLPSAATWVDATDPIEARVSTVMEAMHREGLTSPTGKPS